MIYATGASLGPEAALLALCGAAVSFTGTCSWPSDLCAEAILFHCSTCIAVCMMSAIMSAAGASLGPEAALLAVCGAAVSFMGIQEYVPLKA